ncbi:MAG: DNA repair protein RecO [Nitrospirae bacterium]|nr:DNA repair protein RecO [Nitrospirota bacterium]
MTWIDTAAINVGQRHLSGADRLVTLITPAHGRMRAVARGVCLPRGPLGGALEPFGVCRVVLAPGRGDGLYRVEAADRVRDLPALRADLPSMLGAGLVCAWAGALGREGDGRVLYRLLHHTLVGLARPADAVAPVVARFLWRLTLVAGVAPELGCCVACRTPGDLTGFRMLPGGMVCALCRADGDLAMPPRGHAALCAAALEDGAWRSLAPDSARRLAALAQGYLRRHFGADLPRRAP